MSLKAIYVKLQPMFDSKLKQRLIGAGILILLAVIFIPMLLDERPSQPSQVESTQVNEPAPAPQPDVPADSGQFTSKVTPLDEPPAPPVSRDPAGDAAISDAPEPAPSTATLTPPSPAATPDSAAPPAPAPAPSVTERLPSNLNPDVPAPPAAKQHQDVNAWVVQLGSFSNEQNAVKLRDQLRAKGYAAFMETTTGANGKVARVRVGPEVDRARAEAVRDRLQKEFKIKGIVGRYPS